MTMPEDKEGKVSKHHHKHQKKEREAIDESPVEEEPAKKKLRKEEAHDEAEGPANSSQSASSLHNHHHHHHHHHHKHETIEETEETKAETAEKEEVQDGGLNDWTSASFGKGEAAQRRKEKFLRMMGCGKSTAAAPASSAAGAKGAFSAAKAQKRAGEVNAVLEKQYSDSIERNRSKYRTGGIGYSG